MPFILFFILLFTICRADTFLEKTLKEYEAHPESIDLIAKMAGDCRIKGANNAAYLFAKQGSLLAQARGTYDFHFDEELAISSYYTPFKQEGFEAANRLLLRKDVPDWVKENAHKNILFYIENLKNAQFTPLIIELPTHYNCMNPSICKTKQGYQLICRTVNYHQSRGYYYMNDGSEDIHIHTRNFLVNLDKDFQVIDQKEIVEECDRPKKSGGLVEGLEDCRIIQGGTWFTCTTYDTNQQGIPQISLCQLNKEKNRVDKLVALQGPDPFRCEKNWLPFTLSGSLHLIYSYDPFVVYKPNLENGSCEKTLSYSPPLDFSRFRGSAAPIKFDDGYLLLIHEVIFHEFRYYVHRFVFLDKNLTITKVSKPFTFQHRGIEYCCGMTLDHKGQNIVMPLGIEDREAQLCQIDVETVRTLLEKI